MADKTSNANHFARDQGRITAATAIGMNALKPILHFQVSMLRMWRTVSRGSRASTKRGRKKP